MKISTTSIFPTLILVFGIIYNPRTTMQTKPGTAALIAHLAMEANAPDSHSAGDTYILVRIGKTEYTAELQNGKIIGEREAKIASGGFCNEYVEVSFNLLDKDQHETSQGASQILKSKNGKWKRVALSEGDYLCEKLKGIPQSVLSCLKLECN